MATALTNSQGKQESKRSSSPSVDWSEIPELVLFSIGTHLNPKDFLRFSCVCKSWNSMSRAYGRQIVTYHRPPLLMLLQLASDSWQCLVYSFTERKFIHRTIFWQCLLYDFKDHKFIHRTVSGCNIPFDGYEGHPMDNRFTSFPINSKFTSFCYGYAVAIHRTRKLTHVHALNIFTQEELLFPTTSHYIFSATISAPPSSPDCFLVASACCQLTRPTPILIYCHHGEVQWTEYKYIDELQLPYLLGQPHPLANWPDHLAALGSKVYIALKKLKLVTIELIPCPQVVDMTLLQIPQCTIDKLLVAEEIKEVFCVCAKTGYGGTKIVYQLQEGEWVCTQGLGLGGCTLFVGHLGSVHVPLGHEQAPAEMQGWEDCTCYIVGDSYILYDHHGQQDVQMPIPNFHEHNLSQFFADSIYTAWVDPRKTINY